MRGKSSIAIIVFFRESDLERNDLIKERVGANTSTNREGRAFLHSHDNSMVELPYHSTYDINVEK